MEQVRKFFKDLVGEENEFYNSVDIAIRDRLTSPFYGYFIFSWIIFNWKFLFTIIVVDQDKIFSKTGLLKNEYLESILPNFESTEHWLTFLIYPFLLTWFLFWIAPYITRKFFRKSIRNKVALKIIELKETTQKKIEEKKLVKEEVAILKEEVEKAKQKKKAETENPEILWENEFKIFKKNIVYKNLEQIVKSIYDENGRTKRWISGSNSSIRIIDVNTLAVAHTKGLITILEENLNEPERIELTEKGKYFLSKYLEEKNEDDFF